MVTSVLAAALQLALASQSPYDRAIAFLKTSQDIQADFRAVVDGQVSQCEWQVHGTTRQRFVASVGRPVYEFIQAPTGILDINHPALEYREFGFFSNLISAPEELDYSTAYPQPLLALLQGGFAKAPLKAIGKDPIDGLPCDHLQLSKHDASGTLLMEFWIDSIGMVKQAHFHVESVTGKTDKVFSKFVWTMGSLGPARITDDLPLGYSPSVIPHKFPGLTAGAPIPLTTAKSSDGQQVDLKSVFKGKKGIVLFTSPDCAPSKMGEKAWGRLAAAAKAKGWLFYEVSLGDGPAPKRDWTVLMDADGQMERSWRVAYTPWAAVIDEQGHYLRGWGGYAPDQDEPLKQWADHLFESKD